MTQAGVQRVGEAGVDGEVIMVIRVAKAEIGAYLSRRLQSLLQTWHVNGVTILDSDSGMVPFRFSVSLWLYPLG